MQRSEQLCNSVDTTIRQNYAAAELIQTEIVYSRSLARAQGRMARILVVEDNVDFAFGLRLNLELEEHEVAVVHTGSDALGFDLVATELIVLDLMLPDITGFDVIRAVCQAHPDVPILVLSALAGESDRVSAFRLGADDYVTKPFSLPELLERVKLHLKRTAPRTRRTTKLYIDHARLEATYYGQRVYLTDTEMQLLCALTRAGGVIVTRQQLLACVWKLPSSVAMRTHETHVRNLRAKLRHIGVSDAIRTASGEGYAWSYAGCVEERN